MTEEGEGPGGSAKPPLTGLPGGWAEPSPSGSLGVSDLTTEQIGQLAYDAEITIFELANRKASLEETFMELTGDGQQYAFGSGS